MSNNIVLIGMPGSGKTSLSKALSEYLAMPFIDIDTMIIDLVKMPISEIFLKQGEAQFREYESICTIEAIKHKNSIISTGGGIILRKENMLSLSQNNSVFFIDRSVDNIMQSSNLAERPLVQNDRQKLQNLYNERIAIYRKYAMYTISNNNSFEATCQSIIKLYKEIQENME